MILRGIPRKQKLASYTGRVMIDTVRGVLRVRKWPKKRGTPTSERQLFWIDWFRQANELAKYADPMSQVRAIEEAKNTGKYPRDVLLQAMRGRLYTWADSDGWKWFSVAAIQDISDTLDVLAQTVGGVLVRAKDRWRAPPAGALAEVLTHQGPDDPPIWLPPGGAGGYIGGALVTASAAQALPSAVWTAINFDLETYDTHGIHDPVTNNSRLTVPAGVDRVQMIANLSCVNASGGFRAFSIRLNGVLDVIAPQERHVGTNAVLPAANLSTPIRSVVPGDYFEALIFQNRGTTINTREDVAFWFAMNIIS